MLLGAKLVATNLKLITHVTVPLHILGNSKNFIEVGEETKFLRKIWLTVPFVTLMVVEWIHAWWMHQMSILLLSMSYTIVLMMFFVGATEHFRKRHDIAQLLNAFVDFERRRSFLRFMITFIRYKIVSRNAI